MDKNVIEKCMAKAILNFINDEGVVVKNITSKKYIGISSSKALMGHKVSEETRNKIRNARTGNPTWYKTFIITYPNEKKEIIKFAEKIIYGGVICQDVLMEF